MSRAPLDYRTPSPMEIAKRRYRRFAMAVVLVSLAIGCLLELAWAWVDVRGTAHHVGWISHLGPSSRESIDVAALLVPLLIAMLFIDRAKKKVYGPKLAAKAAEERRLLNEEMAADVWWKVPKSADAAEWPKVLLITALLYVVTFVLVLAFVPLGLLLDWLKPPRGGTLEDMGALHVAFYCANMVGVIGPALFILFVVLPRARVTLISDGVLHRGPMQKLIPYASIREIRIAPSRRRRPLKCVAILASDERFGPLWHRFELGHDAPLGRIVKAFEAKGLSVMIDESGPRPAPSRRTP